MQEAKKKKGETFGLRGEMNGWIWNWIHVHARAQTYC